ncbi:glycoside hydrolase family 65 protein [Tortispora caseinolytica NRRL Y-17796]|uniref:alpha,alpha-trehalase n=1 Tax=Tortispora caseinolytica NRRL Y-17796 TaxID=767744 RepID=A0A1E4T9A3_9ASCO|nr:glycoside hydrolase family 65 protein [Tortispora caseinolytica NRRL Y-17796]
MIILLVTCVVLSLALDLSLLSKRQLAPPQLPPQSYPGRANFSDFHVTGNGTFFNASSWTLFSTLFQENQYQIQPYVANGYIGARLPVQGTGYAEDKNRTSTLANATQPYAGWPLFNQRYTGAFVSGFWDNQYSTPGTNFPRTGRETVISALPVWSSLYFTTPSGLTYGVNTNNLSQVTNYIQALSIRDGIVSTSLDWYPHGLNDSSEAYSLNFTVIAHRSHPTLAAVRLQIVPLASVNGTFTITSALDGQGAWRTTPYDSGCNSTAMFVAVHPDYVNSTVAYEYAKLTGTDLHNVTCISPADTDLLPKNDSTVIQQAQLIDLKANTTYTVTKFVGIASSDTFNGNFSAANNAAQEAIIYGNSTNWDDLIASHRKAWDSIWSSADIVFPSDVNLQIAARSTIYHLLANLRSSDESDLEIENSIAVGGISSDAYAGLIFWDADVWMYPGILALFPEVSKSVLDYRQRLHGQAVINAQQNDLDGAIYPWTSGRYGNCTGVGPCVDYQYHINTDIAMAFYHYYLSTGDTQFLSQDAWPIIRDAADMFVSYVFQNSSTDGKYWTLNLTDPDEYANHINNGAFTNSGISKLMGWAREVAGIVNDTTVDVEKWQDIENNIYIPFNESLDLVYEYDTMNGSVVIKQADVVLLYYPLNYSISLDQSRNDLQFYAQAQSPDGPAMTWAIFQISTAHLQNSGCSAYTFLEYSHQPYLRTPFYQFSEQLNDNPDENGGTHPAFPFLTGNGGFLQTLTHGYTGYRPAEDALILDPSISPQLEGGYAVNGLKWHGAVFNIEINMTETKITRVADSNIPVRAPEKVLLRLEGPLRETEETLLAVNETYTVNTRRPDLNVASIPGNAAQCMPATSNTSWVPGGYPMAAVDGFNGTHWRSSTSNASSLYVSLGQKQLVSRVSINWNKVPAKRFSLGLSESVLDPCSSLSSIKWVVTDEEVSINDPWIAEEALEVKLKIGNTTEMNFERTLAASAVLVVEDSFDEDGLGGTVAEFALMI